MPISNHCPFSPFPTHGHTPQLSGHSRLWPTLCLSTPKANRTSLRSAVNIFLLLKKFHLLHDYSDLFNTSDGLRSDNSYKMVINYRSEHTFGTNIKKCLSERGKKEGPEKTGSGFFWFACRGHGQIQLGINISTVEASQVLLHATALPRI